MTKNKYFIIGVLLTVLILLSASNDKKQDSNYYDCCDHIQVYTGNITQQGLGDPIVDVLGINEVGNIVWTRAISGFYLGTLEGAFPQGNTWVSINNHPPVNMACGIRRVNDDVIEIISWDGVDFFDDDILNGVSFEIRVYDF